MNMTRNRTNHVLAITALLAICAAAGHAQVGKSQGVVDANSAPESALAAMPGMTPAIAKAVVSGRPFTSITDLNTLLIGQGLTQEQAMAFYARAFVHINLNTATREEILLVPGAGTRMAREFAEYRPWKTWAQFDKEIGKYVGAEATAKLAQFCFIPMNANTASDEDLMTVPAADAKLVAAIKAGRPYASVAALEQAIAKATNAKEGKRVARYFVAS
jgi:DNA uptake protein ComE-like DNA-binding protein